MAEMILKMTSVTAAYVILTIFARTWIRKAGMNWGRRILMGLIYGGCSVLSTHFSVDYVDMLLNVRDLGPLAAGLFIDPWSGIMAGIIGGVERYIAGTYWGIGSYTRVACSVSTILAGFLAALMYRWVFRKEKPSVAYAAFMGATMEVFHMYAVLYTHREDMEMALEVVKVCSGPMIFFSGLGLGAIALIFRIQSGEFRNPIRKYRKENTPVSNIFQGWLFLVTVAILSVNFIISFNVQTKQAFQSNQKVLAKVSDSIRDTYRKLLNVETELIRSIEASVEDQARVIALSLDRDTNMGDVDAAYLEQLKNVNDLEGLQLLSSSGSVLFSSGTVNLRDSMGVSLGEGESIAWNVGEGTVIAMVRCKRGILRISVGIRDLMSPETLMQIYDTITAFHVGKDGSFDIFNLSGTILTGMHMDQKLLPEEMTRLLAKGSGVFFDSSLFGEEAMCRLTEIGENTFLLVRLPKSEMYAQRDAQAYEMTLGAVLLFSALYVLISFLVQRTVVNSIRSTNVSLARITQGDLNVVVNVRDAQEFVELSDDINQTVTTLKGYIEAAEKRMEQELEMARVIQASALPGNFDFPQEDIDLYAMMDPAREVGGDFYDFFFTGTSRMVLVIADVSGKGIPASLFMMRSKTAIRGVAESGASASEILQKANDIMQEGNDAEMFVTVWVGILDLETGRMVCANAGHEYPALMRRGGAYELLRDRHGLALAAMPGVRYKEYEIVLNPGDRLFVYTDGAPEATNPRDEQYGTDRLLQVLNRHRDECMKDLLPGVREDISRFADGADQFDDITMLGLVYRNSQKGAPADEGNHG